MSNLGLPVLLGAPPSALRPIRASTWNCRLPVEIVNQVLEILVEKGHLATIGAIQQTSSPLYTAATPYLNRHILLDLPCAVRLFRLFNAFPLCDNLRFLHPVPDIHLMDMHVADRLRVFLSYTMALTLNIWARPFVASPNWREGPKRCHDLVAGLSAFGGPPLWPKLESCDVGYMDDDSDYPAPWNSLLIQPEDYVPVFDAIFAKLHPRHMSIRLPPLDDFNGDEHLGTWVTCQKTLSADHITCNGCEPSTLQSLPHASSTLTLCFDTNQNIPLTEVDPCIRAILRHHYALRDVQQLKIVGLLVVRRRSPDMNRFNDENVRHVFDRIAHYITDLMSYRLQEGNLKDLDIVVLPETTPESEAAGHWHAYKQQEAVTQ
jgi:hypothetical protein